MEIWYLYRELFLLVAGILVSAVCLFLVLRLIQRRRRPLLRLIPSRSFYFTSGSIPPIPNTQDRINRIVAFLERIGAVLPSLTNEEMIEKYVCLHHDLRRQLLKFADNLCEYIANPERERPLNVFLHAPPGSGKSFLVENLVEYTNKLLTSRGSKFTIDYPKCNEINLIAYYRDPNEFIDDVQNKLPASKEKPLLPLLFFDEFDSQVKQWQPFKIVLPLMWEGRIPLKAPKHRAGKCILVFATSLDVLEQDCLDQVRRHYFSKAYNLLRNKSSLFNPDQYTRIKYGIKVLNREADWIRWREYLLLLYRSQSDIEKVSDFFDRIDYFLNIPTCFEYFHSKDKDPSKIYFGDRENIYIIANLIKKYHTAREVEKSALLVMTAVLFTSVRDLERYIFLATCPVGATKFKLEHLDEDLRGGCDNSLLQRLKDEYVHI